MVRHATSNGCRSGWVPLLIALLPLGCDRLSRTSSDAQSTMLVPRLLLLRSERSELLASERRASNSPPSLGRLREEHPGSARLARVARDPCNDLRRRGNELLLPLSTQRAWGRHDLDANRAGIPLRRRVDGGRREAMDVRAGVVRVGRSRIEHALGFQEGGSELLRKASIRVRG